MVRELPDRKLPTEITDGHYRKRGFVRIDADRHCQSWSSSPRPDYDVDKREDSLA